jgi:hypothetical protein
VPDEPTVFAALVVPFDQRYPVPPEAVSVTEPPAQKVVGPPGVITAVGIIARVQVPWKAMLSRYSLFPCKLTPRNMTLFTVVGRL